MPERTRCRFLSRQYTGYVHTCGTTGQWRTRQSRAARGQLVWIACHAHERDPSHHHHLHHVRRHPLASSAPRTLLQSASLASLLALRRLRRLLRPSHHPDGAPPSQPTASPAGRPCAQLQLRTAGAHVVPKLVTSAAGCAQGASAPAPCVAQRRVRAGCLCCLAHGAQAVGRGVHKS